MNVPAPEQYMAIVELALSEDIGRGDITTRSIDPGDATCRAAMKLKEDAVVSGLYVAETVFRQVDPDIEFVAKVEEGTLTKSGTVIAEVSGRAASVLAAERVALNFLQRLSGVATLSFRFARAVRGTDVAIKDTRKTTPGMRVLEKQAVLAGGCANHRFCLDDAVLLKDNHIAMAGGVAEAVSRAKESLGGKYEIEVETATLDEVKEALAAGADIIMLDNMKLTLAEEAVKLIDGQAKIEVSGNVNLMNVDQYAVLGVDYISVGALTHSPDSVDIGMDFVLSDNN